MSRLPKIEKWPGIPGTPRVYGGPYVWVEQGENFKLMQQQSHATPLKAITAWNKAVTKARGSK